jgi:hypothetical protein
VYGLLFAKIYPYYIFESNIEIGIIPGSLIIFFHPANNESNVVFPQPDGPIMAFICPGLNNPFEFFKIFLI